MKLLALFFIFSAYSQTIDDEIVKDLDFYQNLELIVEQRTLPLDVLEESPKSSMSEKKESKNSNSQNISELMP